MAQDPMVETNPQGKRWTASKLTLQAEFQLHLSLITIAIRHRLLLPLGTDPIRWCHEIDLYPCVHQKHDYTTKKKHEIQAHKRQFFFFLIKYT